MGPAPAGRDEAAAARTPPPPSGGARPASGHAEARPAATKRATPIRSAATSGEGTAGTGKPRKATAARRTTKASPTSAKRSTAKGRETPDRAAQARPSSDAVPAFPFDGLAPAEGATRGPASRRALRNQGRRTMRKLLDAAMEAFDRRGYHATRVNDVVEIAKTSHGTFYLYFSNKEDLLRALVTEAAAEAGELYRALTTAPSSTTWEDLRAWIGAYSELWRRYAPLLRAWTDLAEVDEELGALVRETVRTMTGSMAAIVAAGPATDVDADVAGVALLAMLDRFHFLQEFLGTPVDEAALDTLTTLVQRAALRAPSGSPPER